MILFLNARVRNASRTKRLADHLIGKFSDDVKEIKLWSWKYFISEPPSKPSFRKPSAK